METVWDWITLIGFAGLAALLMQRSSEDEPRDKLWQYAPPALGFAVANYVGNEGFALLAAAILLGIAAYAVKVLHVRLPG